MAHLIHKYLKAMLLICLMSMLHPAFAQEAPDTSLLKTLPIDLDAESSEFDRKNNQLRFQKLQIKQGELSIEADEAVATKLDFEDSRWEFSGNVIIVNAGTTARCDYADILFFEHQIKTALMRGEPAEFEKFRIDAETETRGSANVMEYDINSAVIRLSDNAWITDGTNEVSGNRISYDLAREYIIADADESGQVRMKIVPPNKDTPATGDKTTP